MRNGNSSPDIRVDIELGGEEGLNLRQEEEVSLGEDIVKEHELFEVHKASVCQRCLNACYACVALVILIAIVILLTMGALFSTRLDTADLVFDSVDHWPVVDDQGYYQSYKEGGIWKNWWSRHNPSLATVMAYFLFSKNNSSVNQAACSNGNCTLDENLPVLRPYWLSKPDNSLTADGIRATWLGHASVLAEVDGAVILTDPVFSERCSPSQWFGDKRYRPPACTVQELPPRIHAVAISHTHYDHMDTNSIQDLHNRYEDSLHWFVPNGTKQWFSDIGIQEANIHDMVWWQEEQVKIDDGSHARIIFTPSNHWSRRTAFDFNKALWGSWTVIGKNGSKFWFGGDTAYCDVFKQIGKRFGPFDLAAIPIGAYIPRETMKYVHVNPQEAVKIHKDLRAKTSFGIHWGTFVLTYEYYMEPKLLISQIVQDNGLDTNGTPLVDFRTPSIGECVE